jgi:outer membrane protein TolC
VLLLAYLILAAQYDSWTLPLAVLFSVPLALLGSVTGILWVGGANDIFTQIGFVVLVGLSAKNAILIVEFARSLEHEGHDPLAAALEACRLRLRPILMTSLAFIMGVVPLVIATGAGAEMRQSMGISVLSGMIGGTALGLLFTPLFYVLIRRASLWLASLRAPKTAHAAVVAALLGLALVAPDRAHALPPLEHFLEAGRTHALDQRIAEHAVEVGEARRVEARAELLPSVSAIGTYARNQYRIALEADAPARDAVFQAENQLSATFLLDVPLFDLAAWRRVATARAGADAARLDAEATRLEVERRVAAAYYQLLASDALAASARLAEDVAREHLRVVEARVAAGAAPAVERERALADVAQRVEIVAEIDLARRAARRELRTLTGIDVPEDEAVDATTLPDDVAPGVLDELLAGLDALPSVRAARAHAETSRSAVRAARASYAPVVAAQGSERIVNAPGFGPSRQWQIALVARARFDFVTPARVRRTEAETELARLHEEDVRTRARTAIEDAFDRATASRARATAAEARVAAARRTAEEALRRYEVGRAAHLEVIDANREAFSASIELVRARAETAYAVALLRILSGATLEHGRSS